MMLSQSVLLSDICIVKSMTKCISSLRTLPFWHSRWHAGMLSTLLRCLPFSISKEWEPVRIFAIAFLYLNFFYRVNMFFCAESCFNFRIGAENGIFLYILDLKFPTLSKICVRYIIGNMSLSSRRCGIGQCCFVAQGSTPYCARL